MTFLRFLGISFMVMGIAGTSLGALVTNFQTSGLSQTAFPVSTSDLANIGSTALSTYSSNGYSPSAIDAYGPVSGLLDGLAGGSTGFAPSPGGVMDLDGTWSFTVELNSALAPLGYDIVSIDTFTGHIDNRKSQKYSLYVSLVGDNSFSLLGALDFEYSTPVLGSTKLSISDDAGFLARNVDAIRWDMEMPDSGNATVYREFDVYGQSSAAPTVPEPTSIAIFGAGIIGIFLLRRKQKTAVV